LSWLFDGCYCDTALATNVHVRNNNTKLPCLHCYKPSASTRLPIAGEGGLVKMHLSLHLCPAQQNSWMCSLTIAHIHMQEHPASWCSHPSTTTSMSISQACKLAKGLSPALITNSHSHRPRKSQKFLLHANYCIVCIATLLQASCRTDVRVESEKIISHLIPQIPGVLAQAVMLPTGEATLPSVSICLAGAAQFAYHHDRYQAGKAHHAACAA
jgi:hypothetical protein